MSKLYKNLLAILLVGCFSFTAVAQNGYWSSRTDIGTMQTDKAVARLSFPKVYKLYELNIEPLRQQLFSVVDRGGSPSAQITLPSADGAMERFQVWEASNFEPALQARFPQIRAFSGRSLDNPGAMLKISISPQGIQTMVFRSNGEPNEYIEPYSADHSVYAVFKSQRAKGGLPWVCSTPDAQMAAEITQNVNRIGRPESNAGQLKTMRLAQSCNGEYSNFFGATSSAQVALVLAAFNATLTRCNGCYEKDLAIHLNLIANTTAVIYYDPATDPYTTLANWNNQLQATLTANIGEANYDIGHMFGASGGGGNAGCIGCVCVDGQKGRGITSPADGIPQGDNFDIDYVAHEVGHQMGGNHTFSMSNEGTGVNKEVGSGITIMGYAGITAQDVAPHSIDIFHEASIQQIQVNMAGKTCPITTNQAGINATPSVAALTNYTIPISTPFLLTGSATDADPGDVLTYCWEQNDDGVGQTGANSVAYAAKPTGPNWLSFSPTTSPTRLMPRLSTILTGASITGPLPGGDAGANIEALSSVGRTLNFRLTARDNRPYNGTAVGQTNFQDMTVTVSAAVGPFLITSQNAAVSYAGGSVQTVTWSVNGTTGAPTNTANVMISWSTDNGATFTTLIASTPNDGTETFTVPSTVTTQARIKVEAIGNIYFDINNAPITVTIPVNGYTFGTPTNGTATCPAAGPINATLPVNFQGTYTGPVTVAYLSGAPGGTTVSVSPSSFTANGNATVALSGTGALAPGTYNITVQGTGPAPGTTQTAVVSFTINPGSGPAITGQPVSIAVCAGNNASFAVIATGTYQWQVSTAAVPAFTNIAGATSSTLTLTAVTAGMSGNQYRCVVTGQCGSTNSNAATLTVNVAPAVTTNPVSQAVCSGSAVSFTAAGTGTPAPTFQWQVSTTAVPAFTNIAGATNATYTIAATTLADNGNQYRCVLTNVCGSVNTTAATLTVNSSITVTTNPTSQTVCEATNVSFSAAAAGSGLSYQWQVSTDGGATFNNVAAAAPYSGTTSATMTITGVPPTFNNYRYRCVITNGVCTPGITTAATLTVNTFPSITSQPANLTICEGAGATFSVGATTGVGTLTYQWQLSTNGGSTYSNITGATNSSFAQASVPVGQNGYRFRVIVTAGCGSVTSTGAILTVNAYPVITFSPVYVVCKSDAAFTLSATPAGGAFSGTGVSGSSFVPSAAGVGPIAVTYTAANAGCQSQVSRTIQVNECSERHLTLDKYPAVIIYPNPNNGVFGIRLNTDLYSSMNVKVFNSMGQLVKSQVATGLTYGSVINVALPSSAPSGTYHLYLTSDSDKSAKSFKIVVYKN